jgi:outer membrane protein assembly factor BamB
VASGVVYVGTVDGRVHALNTEASTGVWPFATGADVGSSPPVADGAFCIGSDDGNSYRFDSGHRR